MVAHKQCIGEIELEPTRDSALVDLLDRILAKGVILPAAFIISVSGVPLIGINLKAAIAGMKTMLDYGMMEAWDEEIRRYAQENDEEEAPLNENEKRWKTIQFAEEDFENPYLG